MMVTNKIGVASWVQFNPRGTDLWTEGRSRRHCTHNRSSVRLALVMAKGDRRKDFYPSSGAVVNDKRGLDVSQYHDRFYFKLKL